jgi:hypothetical protein
MSLLRQRLAVFTGTTGENCIPRISRAAAKESESAESSPLDDPVIAKALEIFGAEIEEDMRYKQPEPTEHYARGNNLPPSGVLVPGLPYAPTQAQRVRTPFGLTPRERKEWIQDDLDAISRSESRFEPRCLS